MGTTAGRGARRPFLGHWRWRVWAGIAVGSFIVGVVGAALLSRAGGPVTETAPLASSPTSTPVAAPSASTTIAPVTVAPFDTTLVELIPEQHTMTAVVNGDTIEVEGGERVRLLGIDAPNGDGSCYAAEATAYITELIPPGTAVQLVYDFDLIDENGPTLAYVYRAEDELFVNAAMLEGGFATAVRVEPDIAYEDQFVALEAEAREARVGLWGACVDTTTAEAPAPPVPIR